MQDAHALQLEVMEEALALQEAARHLRAVLQQPRAAGVHHRRKRQVLVALCAANLILSQYPFKAQQAVSILVWAVACKADGYSWVLRGLRRHHMAILAGMLADRMFRCWESEG